MLEILDLFPKNISNQILKNQDIDLNTLEEIRLRVQKPIILKSTDKEFVLDYIILQDEILKILQFMCDNSIYSYQNQICKRIHNSKRRTQGWDIW